MYADLKLINRNGPISALVPLGRARGAELPQLARGAVMNSRVVIDEPKPPQTTTLG